MNIDEFIPHEGNSRKSNLPPSSQVIGPPAPNSAHTICFPSRWAHGGRKIGAVSHERGIPFPTPILQGGGDTCTVGPYCFDPGLTFFETPITTGGRPFRINNGGVKQGKPFGKALKLRTTPSQSGNAVPKRTSI